MRCEECGQRYPRGTTECRRCGAPLGGAARAGGRSGEHARSGERARRGSSLVPTVVLALALALVGVGGVQAASLLRHAMRPQSASDVASLVCNALKAQAYDLLADQMDSAPVPPNATGAFNANALSATLRAFDTSAGTVTSCTYAQLSYVDTSSRGAVANYALTVRRAKQTTSQGILLILTQQSDGTWKVARSSNLTGSPTGSP
ncbi:MAG: hypothetical protein IVW57_08805 [Ktedonobacterales bacterium]|nr:hypothetical protein [Ktedonobacterales bacterium]